MIAEKRQNNLITPIYLYSHPTITLFWLQATGRAGERAGRRIRESAYASSGRTKPVPGAWSEVLTSPYAHTLYHDSSPACQFLRKTSKKLPIRYSVTGRRSVGARRDRGVESRKARAQGFWYTAEQEEPRARRAVSGPQSPLFAQFRNGARVTFDQMEKSYSRHQPQNAYHLNTANQRDGPRDDACPVYPENSPRIDAKNCPDIHWENQSPSRTSRSSPPGMSAAFAMASGSVAPWVNFSRSTNCASSNS